MVGEGWLSFEECRHGESWRVDLFGILLIHQGSMDNRQECCLANGHWSVSVETYSTKGSASLLIVHTVGSRLKIEACVALKLGL